MKRLFSAAFMCLVALVSWAQSDSYKAVTEDIERTHSLSSINFSRESVQLLYMFDFDVKESIKNIIDGIDAIRISTHKSASSDFVPTAISALTKHGYEEVDVSDIVGKKFVRLFVKTSGFSVVEAHILTSTLERGGIFSVFGKFKLRDIKKLVEGGGKE